jgi:hypothetical protein
MSVKPSENEEEYFARQEVERRRKIQKEARSTLAEEEAKGLTDSGKGGLTNISIITIYQGASGYGEELANNVASTLGCRCVSREVLVEVCARYGIAARGESRARGGRIWW